MEAPVVDLTAAWVPLRFEPDDDVTIRWTFTPTTLAAGTWQLEVLADEVAATALTTATIDATQQAAGIITTNIDDTIITGLLLADSPRFLGFYRMRNTDNPVRTWFKGPVDIARGRT